MTLKDNIDTITYEAKKIAYAKNTNKKKGALIWFTTEIVQMIIFVMGSFMLLWYYAPFGILTKAGITFLSMIIVYDIFKNFVYVRWVLIKEE